MQAKYLLKQYYNEQINNMKNPYLWYSLHYKCCLVISKIAVPTTSCNYNIIQEIIIMHLDVCDILLHIFVH